MRAVIRQVIASLGRPPSGIAYIPQLDGLRAIAILLVLCWHSSIRASRYVDDLCASGKSVKSFFFFLPHGEIGVALFFFISGYVIAKPFLANRVPGIFQFYVRRMRRIYPPYLIILLISFLILGVLGQNPGRANAFLESSIPLGQSLVLSLTYLHSLITGTASRLLPPAWSLEIEIQFYLLAPFILGWYTKGDRGRKRIHLLAFIGFALISVNTFESFHPFDPRYRFGLLKHLYLFLAGIFAADTADLTASNPLIVKSGDTLFAAGLCVLLGVGYWFTQVDARPAGGLPSLIADLSLLGAVAGLYLGAMHGRLAKHALSWPAFCLVGTMCYSIYLVHLPLMQAIADRVFRKFHTENPLIIWPLWMLVLIPGSILVSTIYFAAVERPFMSSKRNAPAKTSARKRFINCNEPMAPAETDHSLGG